MTSPGSENIMGLHTQSTKGALRGVLLDVGDQVPRRVGRVQVAVRTKLRV